MGRMGSVICTHVLCRVHALDDSGIYMNKQRRRILGEAKGQG